MEFPLPAPDDPQLHDFWAGIALHQLRFPRCAACAQFVWYPQPVCPHCEGRQLVWTQISGPARIFSWTLVRRALHPPYAPITPYVPVILTFDNAPGVRLVSRWINSTQPVPSIGQAVTVVFEDFGAPNLITGRLAPLVR